ncbi:hypothetical protein H8356DRAFT_1421543 [Neocallimastix lanati (nom. inval.)]|nr:hypothetical protein H8356DRAFT_1421543 [Neocallimastix sp. JGI-2020a]
MIQIRWTALRFFCIGSPYPSIITACHCTITLQFVDSLKDESKAGQNNTSRRKTIENSNPYKFISKLVIILAT